MLLTSDSQSPDPVSTAAVARSGAWAFLGQALVLASGFVATPFVVRLLGPVKYGLWSLLQSIRSYYTLADVGMASASTKLAAERFSIRDPPGEATVIGTALILTVGVTSVAALAVSVLAPVLVVDVLRVPRYLRSTGITSVRLVSLAAIAYAATGVINTPQQVRLRWRSLTCVTSGPLIIQIVATPIVLAVTFGSVTAIAALILGATVAALLLSYMVGVRLLPEVRRPRIELRACRHLIAYGGPLAIAALAWVPLMTAERFFLAHFRSTAQVAYYAVAASLGSVLTVIPSAVVQPMAPSLTRLYAEGRRERAIALYHRVFTGVFLLVTPLTFALAAMAMPFLTFWAGVRYGIHSTRPFYVVLGGFWFNTIGYVPVFHLIAVGRTKVIAAVHLAEVIPYLAVAAALTDTLGAMGAAIAWSVRAAVETVCFCVIASRLDGLPWSPVPRRTGTGAAIVLGSGFLMWFATRLSSSFLVRAGIATVVLGLYAVAAWVRVLTANERRGMRQLVRLWGSPR